MQLRGFELHCLGPLRPRTGRLGIPLRQQQIHNRLRRNGYDTTFRLKGKVAGTDIATLSDRDRLLTPTLIFLEAGDIRLEPREEGVYEATGTPLNDSLLLLNRKLEALRNEYIK